jgi:hypothetical protein
VLASLFDHPRRALTLDKATPYMHTYRHGSIQTPPVAFWGLARRSDPLSHPSLRHYFSAWAPRMAIGMEDLSQGTLALGLDEHLTVRSDCMSIRSYDPLPVPVHHGWGRALPAYLVLKYRAFGFMADPWPGLGLVH